MSGRRRKPTFNAGGNRKYVIRPSSLPGFLKRLRIRSGLTLEQVSERMEAKGGYSYSQLKDVEIGSDNPSIGAVLKLLVVYDAKDFCLPAVSLYIALMQRQDFFAFKPQHKAFCVFSFVRELIYKKTFLEEDWNGWLERLRYHAESFGDCIGLSSDETLSIFDLCFGSEDAEQAEANIVASSFTLNLERWFAGVTGSGDVDFSDIFR